MRADVDEVESLTTAVDGAHGAYCMTNLWEHFSAEKETTQARSTAASASTEPTRWGTCANANGTYEVYVAERDVDEARTLNPQLQPQLQTLREWLDRNARDIPIV